MMNYADVLKNARDNMTPKCRVCKVCNGVACRGELPGMGGKGTGESFVRAYQKLNEIKIIMDTLYDNKGQNSSCRMFGLDLKAPVFAAPISGMSSNYNGYFTETTYTKELVPGTLDAGLLAFTGDGVAKEFYEGPLSILKTYEGKGIPTIKPWDQETVLKKIEIAQKIGVTAIAMDVDSAGLPLLAAAGKPVCAKSIEEMKEIREKIKVPFIIKGIMTVEGAKKAVEIGADAIIISNHGGRVLDHTLAPVEVLPKIKAVVGDKITILIDGAIRSGVDVFKVLALGAEGVLIGRPYVVAAYGGNREGVQLYSQKIINELTDTMKMTGCATLKDITMDKVIF